MKDIRVIVRIKNNILISKREELKLNQMDMANVIGVSSQKYKDIENLKIYPIDKHGEWWPEALDIAEYFNMNVEDIFPEAMSHIKTNKNTFNISSNNMQSLASASDPIKLLETKESKNNINKALDTLTPREKDILEQRFGLNGKEETTLRKCKVSRRTPCPTRKCLEGEKMECINKNGTPSMWVIKPTEFDHHGNGYYYSETYLSTERARQIEAKAIRKLRHPKYSELIEGK